MEEASNLRIDVQELAVFAKGFGVFKGRVMRAARVPKVGSSNNKGERRDVVQRRREARRVLFKA